MKKYILMLMASMTLVSCLDTIILPDDKTVDEDFWQTKEQVASMVNAAYAGMTSADVISRLIVWGDFRSDELVRSQTPTGAIPDALAEIAAVNMQTTNTFASWSPVYAVINRCNIVLERAEAVMQLDPNYTMGDYLVDRSQMLALRALCYFFLVRNYHDVPYVDKAYMNSSQVDEIPQSSPLAVLGHCIADLEEAEGSALSSVSYSTSQWQRVGWMTQDAIRTLLADIYLWRASVTHSQADYQRCVDYCDLVIASKQAQHVSSRDEVENQLYPLATAERYYSSLFVSQNAEESIFELQSKSDTALCQYFFKYANNNSAEGWVKAPSMFSTVASQITSISQSSNYIFTDKDMRYYSSLFSASSSGDANLDIRKMISTDAQTSKTLQGRSAVAAPVNYGGLDSNYPVYRLPDVLLMKAEALVQQVDTALELSARQALLQVPFTLVQAVNTRALHNDNKADSMKWTSYRNYSKDQMEILVMQERLREFCFEGKRWYDLMRYHYRHVNYVADSYDKLLADQVDADGNATLGAIYEPMLNLMTRGRGADGPGVRAKMHNEAYLYLPVPNSELILCPWLKQNPAYKDAIEYQKNY